VEEQYEYEELATETEYYEEYYDEIVPVEKTTEEIVYDRVEVQVAVAPPPPPPVQTIAVAPQPVQVQQVAVPKRQVVQTQPIMVGSVPVSGQIPVGMPQDAHTRAMLQAQMADSLRRTEHNMNPMLTPHDGHGFHTGGTLTTSGFGVRANMHAGAPLSKDVATSGFPGGLVGVFGAPTAMTTIASGANGSARVSPLLTPIQ